MTPVGIAQRRHGRDAAHVDLAVVFRQQLLQLVISALGALRFLLDLARRLLALVAALLVGAMEQRVHQQRSDALDLQRDLALLLVFRIELAAGNLVEIARDDQRFAEEVAVVGQQRRHLRTRAIIQQRLQALLGIGEIHFLDLAGKPRFPDRHPRPAGIGRVATEKQLHGVLLLSLRQGCLPASRQNTTRGECRQIGCGDGVTALPAVLCFGRRQRGRR